MTEVSPGAVNRSMGQSSRTVESSPAPAFGPASGPTTLPQAEASATNDFADLRRLVRERGFLERQRGYYAFKISLTLGMLAASLALVALVDILWIQLLNAVFMAFVFTQIGLVGHDAGHQGIASSPKRNDFILLIAGALIWLNGSWWVDKHNRHHANPNDVDADFDVNLPIIAFTEEQAKSKTGLARAIVRYQAFLFFPLLLIEAVSIRADSAQFLLRRKNVKYPVAEWLLLIAHPVAYFSFVFYFLSAWDAALFILVHQSLIGVYMGSVFATNHKGMLMLDSNSRMDFLREQVLTSRNVKANPVTDFVYGGLNYQIEHHLFTTVPRNKLKQLQVVVKDFCKERGISYHETGVIRSYREVLGYLHRVSAPLRRP